MKRIVQIDELRTALVKPLPIVETYLYSLYDSYSNFIASSRFQFQNVKSILSLCQSNLTDLFK